MLGIESDGVFHGFLCPPEIQLQKGVDGGEGASRPPGLWCLSLLETLSRCLISWRLARQVQALPA